ncbi:MAG: histidine kinase dimerization/phospho-acceptor domain-containing protein [Peptococcaceae bacterium]
MKKVVIPLICINLLLISYFILGGQSFYFMTFKETICMIILLFILLTSCFLHIYFFQKHKKELGQKITHAHSQLAANIAHGVRNPLVALKGFLQLEQKKSNSTLGQENIALLLDEIKQIEECIEFCLENNSKPD